MQYIGFNISKEDLEKLKVISFITNKNRTELIKEGIDIIVEKYQDSFDKFKEHVESLKNKNK